MTSITVMSPYKAREMIRKNGWLKPTSGLAHGYIQANLAVLPKDLAFEFLLFCQRNPKPCPIIDVIEPGSAIPSVAAPNADVRTDIPKYRVYRHGKLVEEKTDVTNLWDENMVGFLIGCSFTFEEALLKNGIPIRHIEENRNVPMYKTNIQCVKAGRFEGPMVVSMRPMSEKDAIRSVQVTSRFPSVHGAPVHIGNPANIGIKDIHTPDFGDSVTIKEGEVPVFWACGVTPQAVAMHVKPEIMITHAPGYMFITDLPNEQFSI
ncbi:putative hydro-lyase [Bacillus canaveralius]|uniref:Putative hydro-lyase CU635_12900 n=1 Tax=Bacillus canaveralius TaxID=1403243 RepID=A0A2N5GKL2_9BACI|nr:putative hydro-lyase [Bacillus sp. V33-4]PLR82063.1 putative hydro-lyase [Bacillus canaveralius]PLR98031.1 putative hydro-lyase [Bacillus canaveralius]RSK54389.1 putative hydro-lyase [Bacillus canaveralius]